MERASGAFRAHGKAVSKEANALPVLSVFYETGDRQYKDIGLICQSDCVLDRVSVARARR